MKALVVAIFSIALSCCSDDIGETGGKEIYNWTYHSYIGTGEGGGIIVLHSKKDIEEKLTSKFEEVEYVYGKRDKISNVDFNKYDVAICYVHNEPIEFVKIEESDDDVVIKTKRDDDVTVLLASPFIGYTAVKMRKTDLPDSKIRHICIED